MPTSGIERKRLVVASANPDKVAEIAEILGPRVELIPRPSDIPEVVEDGDTLEANARLKARAICEATGISAVADDTGFEIDALGGLPGVLAARFAGPNATYADNVEKVLMELRREGALSAGQRVARFRTVALVANPDGTETVCEGSVEGTVSLDASGGSGFGYDPIFVPNGNDGRTFAEMSTQEKNAISHRGRAFRALASVLGSGLAPTDRQPDGDSPAA